jgi:hypothetical protein
VHIILVHINGDKMRSLSELVREIEGEKRRLSDRDRQVLYLSQKLVKDVRLAFPETSVSKLVEKLLREVLVERGCWGLKRL